METLNDPWQPIAANAPRDHLVKALEHPLRYHPNWAPRYLDPNQLNSLLTWTSYAESWPLAAFALRHGLSKDQSPPRRIQEVATLLGKPTSAIARVTNPHHVRLYLVRAHSLVASMPAYAQGPNQLRALGFSVGSWRALAQLAGIYTLAQLRELTPTRLRSIDGIGPEKQDEITAIMIMRGLWR